MSRSRLYPWNCVMLQLWFHPLCWRTCWSWKGVKSAEWHQLHDRALCYVSLGPITLTLRFLQ